MTLVAVVSTNRLGETEVRSFSGKDAEILARVCFNGIANSMSSNQLFDLDSRVIFFANGNGSVTYVKK